MAEREVGIAGRGPAAAAVEAAVEDTDATSVGIDAGAVASTDLGVVIGRAGSRAFGRADEAAGGPWIAVELGGIGGYPLSDVDAAVSVLDPDGACFRCLRRRVASNLDASPAGDPGVARPDARLAGAIAGRRAVAVLSGETPTGRVTELPYVERSLLGVPGCACGGGVDRALGHTLSERALEEAVEAAERAVDERLGIVGTVGEAHSFPVPYYLATLCDTEGFSDAAVGRRAAGVAAAWNPAYMRAVGEALERYAAGVYRESGFETAAAAELAGAVPPSAFVRPEEGYAEPDPADAIAWVRGEDLRTGATARLPAEFVHFPPPERRHRPSITTGLALGSSGGGALLAGLYEVIERDATMLAWYSTFEPLGLAVEDPGFEELAGRARSEGLAATALLVTQDVDVPVVAAAVHREAGWPRFAAGSAADLDADAAARDALAEALQNWTELDAMGPDRAAEEAPGIARHAEFPRETRAFVDPDGRIDGADVGEAPGDDELGTVIGRVEDAGLDPYAARLTTRDVAALGFEVVRVLCPAAQPLLMGERFFGTRAREVPRDLGFRPRLDRGRHPYP